MFLNRQNFCYYFFASSQELGLCLNDWQVLYKLLKLLLDLFDLNDYLFVQLHYFCSMLLQSFQKFQHLLVSQMLVFKLQMLSFKKNFCELHLQPMQFFMPMFRRHYEYFGFLRCYSLQPSFPFNRNNFLQSAYDEACSSASLHNRIMPPPTKRYDYFVWLYLSRFFRTLAQCLYKMLWSKYNFPLFKLKLYLQQRSLNLWLFWQWLDDRRYELYERSCPSLRLVIYHDLLPPLFTITFKIGQACFSKSNLANFNFKNCFSTYLKICYTYFDTSDFCRSLTGDRSARFDSLKTSI